MQVDLMTMFETGSDPIIQDSMCNSCCLDQGFYSFGSSNMNSNQTFVWNDKDITTSLYKVLFKIGSKQIGIPSWLINGMNCIDDTGYYPYGGYIFLGPKYNGTF